MKSNERYINIQKGATGEQRQIQSKDKFFSADESVIVRAYTDRIIFKNPSLDYSGKLSKPKAMHSGWVTFLITDSTLPTGKNFAIDSDDNVDEITVYFQ